MYEKWKYVKFYRKNNHGKFKKIKTKKYSISNLGNIRNNISGKILKQSIDSSGYKFISIVIDGIRYTQRTHRLVAYSFLDKTIFNKEVNHIDGNKLNNIHINLEWVSRSRNVLHSFDMGLNNCRKYDIETIELICEMLQSGITDTKLITNELNLEYSVEYRNLISDIKLCKRYKSISSKYNLPNYNKIKIDNILQVEEICKMIEYGHSARVICNILNIVPNTNNIKRIGKIKRRKIYKDISKNYNF